ncbi:MAG: hypothetical protein AM1032_000169 [Mycoplasmataceae bacterium]|nr:MAG: hypothetical protein AM1032_000169 [Mycoplasmataceae bacterium]
MNKKKAIKILSLNESNYNNIFFIKRAYYKSKIEKKRKINDINSAFIFLLFLKIEEDRKKTAQLKISLYSSTQELSKYKLGLDFVDSISEEFRNEVVKDIKNEYKNLKNLSIYSKTICNFIIWLIFMYKISKNKRKDNFLILRFAFYSLISLHLNFISLIFLFIIEFIAYFYQRKNHKFYN